VAVLRCLVSRGNSMLSIFPLGVGYWRCCECGRDTHAPSVVDPARCIRCAPAHYIWRNVVFGRIRKVPPCIAARWS
jgi:hypothetical protein